MCTTISKLGRRNLNDFCKAEIVLRNTALIGEITEKARERQSGGQGGVLLLNNCSKGNEPINQRKVHGRHNTYIRGKHSTVKTDC